MMRKDRWEGRGGTGVQRAVPSFDVGLAFLLQGGVGFEDLVLPDVIPLEFAGWHFIVSARSIAFAYLMISSN